MLTPSDTGGAIISSIVILGLLVLGLMMRRGRCASLVAGYNTLSGEERKRVDDKALCRFTGSLILIVDACIALTLVAAVLDIIWLVFLGIALVFIVAIGGILYANRKGRFHREK